MPLDDDTLLKSIHEYSSPFAEVGRGGVLLFDCETKQVPDLSADMTERSGRGMMLRKHAVWSQALVSSLETLRCAPGSCLLSIHVTHTGRVRH